MTTATATVQMTKAEQIVAALTADGRFEGKLWAKGDKVRVYVEGGYIAIGIDGTVYPSLARYRGNIMRAAGL